MTPPAHGEITALLAAARAGAPDAARRLFSLVYDDLRSLAARHVREAAGHGATSLVHEAFLRFTRQGTLPYEDRLHFFAAASRAMRQVVIDDARARHADKRGGGAGVVELTEAERLEAPAGRAAAAEVLRVDQALGEMERTEPELARIVEWHFFGGLTFAEIADALGVSERTALRQWRVARAVLHTRLSTD
jgi:RNA polymerase sigma factor (TIGR02999 family)